MPDRVSVSSGDFIRNIGFWQDEALRHPVFITYHGRERLVLAAAEQFRADAGAADEAGTVLSSLRADVSATLENLEDAFLAFDAQGCVVASNAAAQALLGVAPSDLKGAPADKLFPHPFAAVLRDRIGRVTRARKVEVLECALGEGHVNVRAYPMANGVGAFLRNTTWQYDTLNRLELCEALERATAAHAATATIVIDARGRIERASASFCDWTGFTEADVLGHRLADLARPDERRGFIKAIEDALGNGGDRQLGLTLVAKQGQEVSTSVSIAPLRSEFSARGAVLVCTRRAEGEDPR